MDYPAEIFNAAKERKLELLSSLALGAHLSNRSEGLFEWRSTGGLTALLLAAQKGHYECVEQLTALGADVNARVASQHALGATVLLVLLRRHDVPISTIRLLLSAGDAHPASCALAVSAGAKMLIEDSKGETAWDLLQAGRYQIGATILMVRSHVSNDAVFENVLSLTRHPTNGVVKTAPRTCVRVLNRQMFNGSSRRYLVTDGRDASHSLRIDTVDLDPPRGRIRNGAYELTFNCQWMLRTETRLDAIGFRFCLDEDGRSLLMEQLVEALVFNLPEHLEVEPTSSLNAAEVGYCGMALSAEELASSSPVRSTQHKNCVICLDLPVSAGFVHGSSVHRCACTRCAEEIGKIKNARCPLCREPIQTVVTQFYA